MLLRIPDVERRTGLKRSTIYKKVASGDFPAPVKLTSNTIAFHAHEVDRWCNERPLADVKGPHRNAAAAGAAG